METFQQQLNSHEAKTTGSKTAGEVDERTGTIMFHPLFGPIKIKEIRKTEERTLAYFAGSVCNINILRKIN